MKGKTVWILAGCLVLAAVLGLILVSGMTPAVGEEEVRGAILAAMAPQLKGLEQVYGVESVELEVKIESLSVKKPTLFEDGSIRVTITDCLKSPSFTELEGEEIDLMSFQRYLEMGRFLCYDEVTLEGYRVTVEKGFGADETRFVNSSGSRYQFTYVASGGSYKAYKDGGVVFDQPVETREDSGVVCYRCNGTGKVQLTYGNSWSDEPGYSYGSECGACGGTGYR